MSRCISGCKSALEMTGVGRLVPLHKSSGGEMHWFVRKRTAFIESQSTCMRSAFLASQSAFLKALGGVGGERVAGVRRGEGHGLAQSGAGAPKCAKGEREEEIRGGFTVEAAVEVGEHFCLSLASLGCEGLLDWLV